MKKLSIFLLFVLLAGSSIATATSLSSMANMKTQTSTVLDPTGTFDGSIGHRRQGNWTAIGAINGTYVLRNRFGRFNGEWSIHLQNQNASGTMKGGFGRHLLIGRITIEGKNRAMPIIGFIGFNETGLTFRGRFMSLVGPALYFKGTYT